MAGTTVSTVRISPKPTYGMSMPPPMIITGTFTGGAIMP